ncbi:MAG: DUF87 domain-containing protein [Rhizobiaceae bacterium]|nr:DUF87 domain-containing protein [Rhizobiaceae bacterium]
MNLTSDLSSNVVEQHEAVDSGNQNHSQADNETGFIRNRTEGHVVCCDGETVTILAKVGKATKASDDYWAVGQLISVRVGENRIVGMIYKLEAPEQKNWTTQGDNLITVHIELVGEITTNFEAKVKFNSGISNYPHLGAIAHRIRAEDLAAIYQNEENSAVKIGSITQDSSIPALISIDKLLSRHFAVVGTTGVGKSTSVALILRKIVEQRPDIRTLILDPHNEFATAFPDHAITVDASTLDLPFWMFTLEEFVEVIFRGRPGIGEEVDALRDFIPEAKIHYERGSDTDKHATLVKRGREPSSFTADTPVPYRMPDLLKLMDEKLGQLDGKAERPHIKALKNRIESIMNDPRFKFMFDGKSSADAMNRLLSHVFRIPQNGKPICVFELSGIPSEVVNVVASVMCRLAFDLGISSQGTIQTLVVCEEAHRYIPADASAGFLPTRTAIARIAKEGRKYGVYLGVITQRPGELDSTILSQCNTIFSIRLGNEYDQEIVRQALTGGARSTASFLSSLANRECIAFGEAIDSPMRMMFETVAKKDLPGSHIYENQEKLRSGGSGMSLASVINTMRQKGVEKTELREEDYSTQSANADFVGEQKPSLANTRPTPQVAEQPRSVHDRDLPASTPMPGEIAAQQAVASTQQTQQIHSNGSQPQNSIPPRAPIAPPPSNTAGGGGLRTSNLIRNFRAR